MGRTPVCKRMIYFFLCSKDSEDTNRANNLFDFSFKFLACVVQPLAIVIEPRLT